MPKVTFEQVLETFHKDNPQNEEGAEVGELFIRKANDKYPHWVAKRLNEKKVLGIVLPPHSKHGGEPDGIDAIPKSGSTVGEVLKMLDIQRYKTTNPVCASKITELMRKPLGIGWIGAV